MYGPGQWFTPCNWDDWDCAVSVPVSLIRFKLGLNVSESHKVKGSTLRGGGAVYGPGQWFIPCNWDDWDCAVSGDEGGEGGTKEAPMRHQGGLLRGRVSYKQLLTVADQPGVVKGVGTNTSVGAAKLAVCLCGSLPCSCWSVHVRGHVHVNLHVHVHVCVRVHAAGACGP